MKKSIKYFETESKDAVLPHSQLVRVKGGGNIKKQEPKAG